MITQEKGDTGVGDENSLDDALLVGEDTPEDEGVLLDDMAVIGATSQSDNFFNDGDYNEDDEDDDEEDDSVSFDSFDDSDPL